MSAQKNPYLAKLLMESSLALGLALPAFAQPIGAPMPLHEHRAFDGPFAVGPFAVGPIDGPFAVGPIPLPRELQLTETQEDQIFKIFHDQAPAARERMKSARRSREELERTVRAQNFDRARARGLADAEAKALADLALMRAESMRRVREVLTPEQRAKLDEGPDRRIPRGPR